MEFNEKRPKNEDLICATACKWFSIFIW